MGSLSNKDQRKVNGLVLVERFSALVKHSAFYTTYLCHIQALFSLSVFLTNIHTLTNTSGATQGSSILLNM